MVTIGEKAPEFKAQALIDGVEKEVSLKDFKGKKIALYFYPKDLTPGCTTQAENLRDNYDELQKQGIEVLGVSKDSLTSHKNFSQKKELPFPLISDEDLQINNAYGVWQEKKFMGKTFMGTMRTTFLIDEDGIIKQIITKPNVKEHTQEVLKGFQ